MFDLNSNYMSGTSYLCLVFVGGGGSQNNSGCYGLNSCSSVDLMGAVPGHWRPVGSYWLSPWETPRIHQLPARWPSLGGTAR